MNREELEFLKELQREFSAPFDPQDHDIRDLPGGKQWVYVPHHKYRIRACEIYPAIQIEFGDYNQTEKHTMLKCMVTVLGVKREAWGVVETSPLGERGNCFDRATAEATKNALEQWGMGAYLDDQPMAARIMSKAINSLSQEKKSKFNSYCKSLRVDLGLAVSTPQPQKRGDSGFLDSVGEAPKKSVSTEGIIEDKVTQKQLGLLHARAKECNIDGFTLKSILKNQFGYDSATQIDKQIFNSVLGALETAKVDNAVQEKQDEEGRKLIIAEIDSLMKRKSVTNDMGRDWVSHLYAVKSRALLSDEQLNDFLAKMRVLKVSEDSQKRVRVWEYNGQALWTVSTVEQPLAV